MASIQDIERKMNDLIKLVDAERERDLVLISNDAKALIANRIQNTGVDADGSPLAKYSDNGIPAYRLFNKERPSGSKIGNDVDALAQRYGDNVSHGDVREFYGLPTNYTNLTYTGEMWNDVGVKVVNKDKDSVEVSIAGLTVDAQEKVNLNSERYGNILALSDDEINLLTASAVERRRKQINRIFT